MDIKISFPGNKKINADFNGFTVYTDQKKEDGGDESHPTPFEFFLASIAACAGHYLMGFCTKRDIPMDGISLEQKSVHDDEKKKIIKLITEIHIPNAFPQKYLKAVINAVNACTVKKYIEKPFEFETVTKADNN
jgi:ribosomal protein S12 methylthiotransferase accessory factor